MVKPENGMSLGQKAVDEMARAIEILRKMTSAPAQGHSELRRFRDAFAARYQDGEEVPLVVALDEELGTGFNPSANPTAEASPLLRELVFPPSADEETSEWRPRHAFLLGKLHDALASGKQEMTLSPQDSNGWQHRKRHLCRTLLRSWFLSWRPRKKRCIGANFACCATGCRGPGGPANGPFLPCRCAAARCRRAASQRRRGVHAGGGVR